MELPKHIAIMPDGNRRFARKRGLLPWKGHEYGMKKGNEIFRWWAESDIPELSVWLMSTENLNRAKDEIETLFKLFRDGLKSWEKINEKIIHDKGIKVRFVGDLKKFPADMVKLMKEIEEKTSGNNNKFLNVLIGYGGKFDITTAVNNLIKLGKKKVTEKDIENNLLVKNDVDLAIRTGGMPRLSGFMLWQLAYAEIYMTKTLFPALTKREFMKAIRWYGSIKRNFGK